MAAHVRPPWNVAQLLHRVNLVRRVQSAHSEFHTHFGTLTVVDVVAFVMYTSHT